MRTAQITEDLQPQLAAMMRSVPIFSMLTDDQQRRMLPFVGMREYGVGETVFKKGDEGDAFYAIFVGKVEVSVEEGLLIKTKNVLRTMGPGEFLGELALLLKQPRSATIACLESTQFFVISKTDFELMLERNKDIADAVKKAGRERYEYHP